MKTYPIMIVLVMTLACVSSVRPQSNTVPWSAIDAGFAVAFNGGVRVASVLGQPFVGMASISSSGIRSGFLAYPFRPALSSGVKPNADNGLPTIYDLSQNYPNPFNPKTVVRSQTPEASNVRIVIYDVLGREVKVLVNERRAAGHYEDNFDASGLASGMYIYRMTAGAFVQTRKMILLK